MMQETTDFRDNIAELRIESLKIIVFFVGIVGFVWYVLVGHPAIMKGPAVSAWVGVGVLTLSAGASYLLRNRSLWLAAHLLVWGAVGSILSALFTFSDPGLVYLLIVPIILSSVLLSQLAFCLTAAAAVMLALVVGLAYLRVPFFSADLLLPVLLMALVTLASWIAQRNLRVALAWVWNGYEQARHNEAMARQRAGELRRALKALDEATHRLERANYMLALARDQAEEARRLKQRFAQNISHELRTPLNLIVGFTELMTESPEHYGSPLPPAYMRDLNITYRNACHLQKLVNDVLDLSRIEAAQMAVVLEETDAVEIVQDAVDTMSSLVEAHDLALYTDIDSDLPMLRMDATRIRQVLFNLLNNAVRFTDEGSITVSVHRRDGEVVFAVADTGEGISPDDIAHVFEEFRQADSAAQRPYEGTGLGLAISRQFVELHGGHMWVESRVGQCSVFYFSLPVDGAETPSLVAQPLRKIREEASAKGSEEPVLLIVTRSPSAAGLLTRYVYGCRSVVVPDLEQACRTARRLMPQVVVVDKTSTEVDGGDLEDLARSWGLPRVPLLACPLPGEESLRRQMAADGYLVKPVSRENLWEALRGFGEDVDSVLVVDDDPDFVLLISRMLEDNPVRQYQVISAYGGQEALDMVRQHGPDLVLLDLGLPDIDGSQVLERIRSSSDWQHVPVIIVSAQDTAQDQGVAGVVSLAKAEGLALSEMVQLIQHVVSANATVTSP